MNTLKDHLAEILRSRDFEVADKNGYLYGSREDVSVVVLVASDMLTDDVQDFIRNVSDFQGRKIVASIGKLDEGVQSILQKQGIYYWDREDVEHEIGSLQLRALGSEAVKSLLDEVISDEMPQRPAEPPEQSIPVIVESTVERSERIVKPNFSLEDVKSLARHDIQGYRYALELVPHYLFHYVLNLEDGKQRAGIVAVNALTEHIETWRWGFELVDTIDIEHTRREPKIDQEKASELAREEITKEYRSFTEQVKDFGHSEIIERKKPRKDPMVVEPKGLVYLPVWSVEGKGGAMIVNSSSGKIISEHLHGLEARRG
ncbi:MAG: hypothetical protein AB7S97_00025 [Thermoplasmata archaeon]